jgi:hypothetical protein
MAILVMEFQVKGYKIRKMNQHTHSKLLIFENWCSGEVSKSAKFDFQCQFSTSKSSESVSIFFIEDAQFLTAPHYTNSQNSIISFGYVDF